MTYRSFVPKRSILSSGSATVATSATVHPRTCQVSQLSQVSQPRIIEKGPVRVQSVAKVASVAGVDSEIAAAEERAALVQYGAGVPRDWAEGFARLDLTTPPSGFSALRWQTVINDGCKFLDRWAAEAARLGWQAEDVFGAHPLAPSCRYDQMGLVLVINDGEVTLITATSASIRTTVGSVLTYTRLPKNGAVCIWEVETVSGEGA
jgi:hypothetical protein